MSENPATIVRVIPFAVHPVSNDRRQPPSQGPMTGSGMPKPLTNTSTQNIVSPAAMMSVVRHRNRVLAYALMITSNGSATASPAPRTRKPKTTTDSGDQQKPLERKPTDRRARHNKGSNHCNRADDGKHAPRIVGKKGRAHPDSRSHVVITSDNNRARAEEDVEQAGPEIFGIARHKSFQIATNGSPVDKVDNAPCTTDRW